MKAPKTVGAQLRRARQINLLTQVEVGERLGVDHTLISRWETGAVSPTVDQFLQLCALYEIEPGRVLAPLAA